jgi:hypothetical protein
MINKNFKKDLREAVKIVWIIYSALILLVILITFFSPETLYKISPVCYSISMYGLECFMCGMTRAFIEISGGNFFNAYNLNRLSIFLFSVLLINSAVFVFYIFTKFKAILNKKRSVKGFQNKKLFQN